MDLRWQMVLGCLGATNRHSRRYAAGIREAFDRSRHGSKALGGGRFELARKTNEF